MIVSSFLQPLAWIIKESSRHFSFEGWWASCDNDIWILFIILKTGAILMKIVTICSVDILALPIGISLHGFLNSLWLSILNLPTSVPCLDPFLALGWPTPFFEVPFISEIFPKQSHPCNPLTKSPFFFFCFKLLF